MALGLLKRSGHRAFNAIARTLRVQSGAACDPSEKACRSLTRNGTIARRVTMDATIYLLILVVAFMGIVIWAFGRKRKARFEADARIPFDDDKGSQS